MRGKRGFTLLEILVSLAVIAILSSLTFTLAASAKDQARERSCASNLRQIRLAVEMYRNDHDGGAGEGTIAQMALPPDPSHLAAPKGIWLACNGAFKGPGVMPLNYQWLAGVPGSQVEEDEWVPTTRRFLESTVLISDWRHNDAKALRTRLFPKLGLGVTVDGQARRRTSSGHVPSVFWWHEPQGQ